MIATRFLVIAALVCAISISSVYATVGVDMSTAASVSTLQCLRNNGKGSFAIPRVYQSIGRVDSTGVQTVKNAHAAGVPHVDGYIFPCFSCGNGAKQVVDTITALRNAGASIGMIWFDVEGTQYWGGQAANQAFFNSMVSGARSVGATIGVYTSASQWGPIMGSWTGGSSFPLWYAHYDNNPSFSDFKPFGGWSRPAMKQYVGDTVVCSLGVDLTWYP